MSILRKCAAECIGTYLLVFFGCGVVHCAVLTGSQAGLWQVAVVWGIAVMLGIYSSAAVSGAHINPAITLALALRGRCSWKLVLPYAAAQTAGAFLAAATLFVLFTPFLEAKEYEKLVARGQPGSEVTAMCYGEYYPSPGPLAGAGPYTKAAHEALLERVSQRTAFLTEMLATAILALVVFAVTDPRNVAAPGSQMAPVVIGLTVAALISVVAPLTQGCFNPARDFGPRLFAYLAGWGEVAIPGQRPNGFLIVYIAAPMLGAAVGAHVYDWILRPRQ